MKSSVLRACILGPYVPLRTSFKRKRVADKLCLPSHFHNICLCKMMSDIFHKDKKVLARWRAHKIYEGCVYFFDELICATDSRITNSE